MVRAVFCELLATYSTLREWKQNPSASKLTIGVWSHWRKQSPENGLTLSPAELAAMKEYLRKHAPTSYKTLFAQ
jgi:hypothetical protein